MSSPGIPDRLGNYDILEHLASGGMAEIYLAEQRGPHGFRKRVVVKRIKSDHSGDPNFETMFLDEARLSAQLSHPNIVQTYELDHSGEQWFVAMEYIDGPSFEELLLRAEVSGQPVDPRVVVRVISDVLAALTYAHDFIDHEGQHLAIVHRDVTPSNVLITTAGVAKLADFGIAKAVGRQTETQTGAVKGKYGYMAPEQITGDPVDGRTDVFAVGIMLYEALSGAKPFGEGLKAVHGVIQSDPKPLTEATEADLPQALTNLVDAALRKDPDERPQSAARMLLELEGIARDHGLLGTATDVVEGLGIRTRESDDEPDAHAATVMAPSGEVGGTAVVHDGPAATDDSEAETYDHTAGLRIFAVGIAAVFFIIAAILASFASSDSQIRSVDAGMATRPDAGPKPTPAQIRDQQRKRIEQMQNPKNQTEEEREAAKRREELEREARKQAEELRKKREKRLEKARKKGRKKGKERGRGRGKGRKTD